MKRQHILMIVSLIAALLMVHNGHVQQSAYLGFGWAFDTRSVGYINLGERRITYLGFFNDPNDLGMFLVMNIPFAIYFYTQGKFITKLVMLIVLTAIGYGIYLTGSRGTMVGAGALIIIYYLIINAGPKLIIITALFSPVVMVAYTVLQSGRDESSQQRLEAWYEGVHMLLNNPIFGVGRGQFQEVHGRVAHNSYIQMAAELGVPGYSLWGGALIFTVLVSYLILKDKTHHKEKGDVTDVKSDMLTNELLLNKTLLFSMIAFMVTGFFISRNYSLLLYVFIGMTLASNIRVIKMEPYYLKYFNNQVAIRSMGICWFIIAVVYLALKIGL
jgi:O-antigen ligase